MARTRTTREKIHLAALAKHYQQRHIESLVVIMLIAHRRPGMAIEPEHAREMANADSADRRKPANQRL